VDRSTNTLGVLLNNGAGGLGTAASYAVGTSPQAVASGDFNGDGKPDLVTANAGSNSVSVLLNTGAGGFTAAADYATGSGTVAVAVGDLNGDGKADLATAGGNAVGVLLGNGNGTFAPAVSSATNYPDYSVAIGDFNQDGKADLALGYAVVSEYSYSYCDYTCYDCYFWGCGDCYTCHDYYTYETDVGVTVLEGGGNGTFGPETDVWTNSYGDAGGESVSALAVSDFDHQGFPDLAAVESAGS